MSRRENTSSATRSGSHDRATYLALIYGLYSAGRSGVLRVESGHHWREVFLVGGAPAWYHSSLESETLSHSLVASGAVAQGQMKWITSKLAPDEDLVEVLVVSGAISAEDVEAHSQGQIERGYTGALSWERGKWSFEPRDGLDPSAIDPALLGDVSPLKSLWQGVRQQLEMDQILPVVSDPDAGVVAPCEDLARVFPGLEVDEPFADLPGAIGEASSVEELFRKIPDRSGNLVKLLWLVEIMGLVTREGREAAGPLQDIRAWVDERVDEDEIELDLSEELVDVSDQPEAAAEAPPPTPPPPAAPPTSPSSSWSAMESSLMPGHPAETTGGAAALGTEKKESGKKRSGDEIGELLITAHRHRMGKDYYAFLGVDPSASLKEIRKAYKRLARHWKAAATTDGLTDEAVEIARDLSTAARRVWQTMSDQTLRQAYNRRLAQGSAPVVRSSRKQSRGTSTLSMSTRPSPAAKSQTIPPWEDHFRQARLFMENADFDRAQRLLERARRDNPSSADVLAELGWCTWMTRGFTLESGEAAEEFLRLAATFDPRHVKAVEYLARIAVKVGDAQTARSRVQMLLRIVPDHAWALRTLSKTAAPEDEDQQGGAGGSRLRFWKKKG